VLHVRLGEPLPTAPRGHTRRDPAATEETAHCRAEQRSRLPSAHNDTDPDALLPPVAARLLIAMFPHGDVCQRSLESHVAEGFDRSTSRLLRALVEPGFLSKEVGHKPRLYRLHLAAGGAAMRLRARSSGLTRPPSQKIALGSGLIGICMICSYLRVRRR
jgi:hypothetical protein